MPPNVARQPLYPTPDRLVRLAHTMAEARVLDTAALIAWPISELSGGMIVQHQEEELQRISPDRAAILDSLGLVNCQPSQESMDKVAITAKDSGDISGISETDLSLISLALERSAILVTDDYRMQNIATTLEIPWQTVSELGIREVWSWVLICSGCGIEVAASESTNAEPNEYGNCHDCGSTLRLKRRK